MSTAAFLRRIGLSATPGAPSVENLRALQAAFVNAVPYESVQYQLGHGGPLDPRTVAERIIAREAGGYCFQLNGAFALLLDALGYEVTLHRGGVQTRSTTARADATHLALTVTNVPGAPKQPWLVDAGLGDGLRTPLPLQVGVYEQAPYEFGLRRSEVTAGWRLDHDARSSIVGMDFASTPATLDAFAAQHARLSTSPDSPFVRVCSAFRRCVDSVVALRSCELAEVFADRIDTTVLETPAEFFAVLDEVFQLPMSHLGRKQRDQLWRRVVAQYDAFIARTTGAG